MRLLPGDHLWERYRVESVTTSRCDSALLSALQKGAVGLAPARYRLISLVPDSQHPLSELMLAACRAVRGGALLAIEAASRRKRGVRPSAADVHASVPHDERPTLALIGKAEWIGEPGEDAIAIVELPAVVPLKQIMTGAPDARQVLWLFKQLTDAAEFWMRMLSDERTTRDLSAEPIVLLARQLQAERLQVRRDNSQLLLATAFVAPKQNSAARPPAHAYSLAPEVYNGTVSSPALTFAVARAVAAVLASPEQSGTRQTRRLVLAEQNRKPAEAEWAGLAAWISGKRDPAAEFKESTKQSELPAELRTLLSRCLARTPARRPSLTQLSAALSRMVNAAWADGETCQGCGIPLRAGWSRECPICSRPVALDAEVRRAKRVTATVPRRSAASLPAVARVPDGMMIISAGAFLSGERKVPRTLRDFAIDKTPVTEGEYKKFLVSVKRNARPGGPGSKEPAFDNHPVTQISWYDANEFAEFFGKRLPTVYEWEKASRGLDGRKFPYGETFKPATGRLRLPSEASSVAGATATETVGTVAVGTYAAGASPYGILDMAGNVLEWTSSARRAGDRLYRALKGACFRDGSSELARCASIQYLPPETVEPFIGFRCVKDLD